jgi:hypothetical protein
MFLWYIVRGVHENLVGYVGPCTGVVHDVLLFPVP